MKPRDDVQKEPVPEPAPDQKRRRIVLLRSVLTALASWVPVPGVSELFVEYSRRGLIEHLAREHQIELDEGVVSALLEEPATASRFSWLASLGRLLSLVRRQNRLRRLFAGFQVLSGLETGFRTFETGTLFAHYLGSAHMGQKLQLADAQAVRKTMIEASAETEKELLGDALAGLAMATFQTALALPGFVWDRVALRSGQPLSLPEFSAVTETAQKFVADLRLRNYAKKLAEHFDRKWKGPAVITISPKTN